MEYDGLIVPSARHPSSNLVIFMDRLSKGFRLELTRSEPVDSVGLAQANPPLADFERPGS